MVLVDGHNLLFALRARFAEHLVEGHPGADAREALVQALLDAFADAADLVRIYFDGATPHREQRSAQVEVIYPGGAGDQRADRAILRDLTERPDEFPVGAITVVTRDIKLARRARKRGATIVDPEAFFAERT
ncbi:NYN domain-containing protein [Lentisalinibacter salinarum]|uniref:NYN domain-containing protein n=1 Tax=Lentisalinibacter salinarum TaxID=2992239 RepID=UPI0038680037